MLTECKSFADAFIIQTCGNNKQLDYANSAEHELRMFSSVLTESLQFSLVSCKNWKTNEYSTYLQIQKYIKVNLIHTLGKFIEHRRRCQWILLTQFIESEVAILAVRELGHLVSKIK